MHYHHIVSDARRRYFCPQFSCSGYITLYLVRPGFTTLWGLKKTFQLSSTYVLTPAFRKINLIINSTHLSCLISANWTFHICDHNRSFPQSKNRSFHKISFSIDPYVHSLCCLMLKNSEQSINMMPTKVPTVVSTKCVTFNETTLIG